MVFIIVGLVGYSLILALAPPAPRAAGSTKPSPPVPCVGSVAEYCKRTAGVCPPYGASVERWKKTYCKQPRALSVFAHDCKGVYRSLSWRQPTLLFGSDEYFDADGRFVAAYEISDALDAYCKGSSSSQTFGSIPACPTEPVITDLCRK